MAASRLIQANFSCFMDQNSSCLNCKETHIVSHGRQKKERTGKGENQLFLAENRAHCDGRHLFPKYFVMAQFGTV